MPLCFIEPQEAIRVVAESVGREARRQLLGEVVRAWVDEIPDDELLVHYAKAVEELDDDDLSILAAWHASLEVGQPIANKEFLLGAFSGLGEHRRPRKLAVIHLRVPRPHRDLGIGDRRPVGARRGHQAPRQHGAQREDHRTEQAGDHEGAGAHGPILPVPDRIRMSGR